MKLLKLYLRKNSLAKNCLPIILTILWLISSNGHAQKLDSLKRKLTNARGSALCSIYYQIGYELMDVNFEEALVYAKKSVLCAEQIKDSLQVVRGVKLKALAFRRIGAIDSSNKVIIAILPMARQKEYFAELQDLLNGLALGMLYKAQFDESLRYNFESLEIRRMHGTSYDVGSALANIGFTYYKLADYSTAQGYFKQSLDLLMSNTHNDKLIEKVLVNMALSYAYSGHGEKAHKYLAEVLRRCNNNCAPEDLMNVPFCRGIVALNRGDTASAKLHFFESYTRAVADNHERMQLDNIIYLSRIHLSAENMTEAARYLDMAEKLITKGVPYNMELMKVYNEFAALYERKGDYKKVADFLRRHMALKDSIYDDEVTTSLMRIEATHVEKEKNAKIEMQNRLLELNDKIIFRQWIATILAVTTAVFLTGFVVLLIRSVRDKKRRNKDLEQRVKNRTGELEALVNQSHRWLDEKKQWVEKIVISVRHSTNTIAGLSSLATRDTELSGEYIKLIDQEVKQLLTHVSNYASKSDEGARDFRGTS